MEHHLVLDLDGTLVHSEFTKKFHEKADFTFSSQWCDISVKMRPGLIPFLRWAFEHFTSVSIWTAGSKEYAHAITAAFIERLGEGYTFAYILSEEDVICSQLKIKEASTQEVREQARSIARGEFLGPEPVGLCSLEDKERHEDHFWMEAKHLQTLFDRSNGVLNVNNTVMLDDNPTFLRYHLANWIYAEPWTGWEEQDDDFLVRVQEKLLSWKPALGPLYYQKEWLDD